MTPTRYKICDTYFWNTDTFLSGNQPRLSLCFRRTVLVWLPACWLLVALVVESFRLRSACTKGLASIPWNWFNRLRLMVSLFLVGLKLSESIDSILEQAGLEGARVLVLSTLMAPLVQVVSYTLLAAVYYQHRRAGIHTSGPIFIYIFAALICELAEFYQVWTDLSYALYEGPVDIRLVHLPLLSLLFLLECYGDTPTHVRQKPDNRNPLSPQVGASFLSNFFYWWFRGLLMKGYKKDLDFGDLWTPLDSDRADRLGPMLLKSWLQPKASSGKSAQYQIEDGLFRANNDLILTLVKIFWPALSLSVIMRLIRNCLNIFKPLLLRELLVFIESDRPSWYGYSIGILFLIIPGFQTLAVSYQSYILRRLSGKVRSCAMAAIYRKALTLGKSGQNETTSGEIVNLMAVDAQRFEDLLVHLNLLWSAPVEILMALAVLYSELGWASIAGLACMIAVVPFNTFIASQVKTFQIKMCSVKDKRIKQVLEVLAGMKVLKLYAWENSFINNLLGYRNDELRYMKKLMRYEAIGAFSWQCSPFIVAVVTFTVYMFSEDSNALDAEKVFVSLNCINLLRFPLGMLPEVVSALVFALVSAKRISKFLNGNELVNYVTREESEEAITVERGKLAWVRDDEQEELETKRVVLKDIELHVKHGGFVAIVGQVASGKSSLLSAVLGEMNRLAGRFNIAPGLKLAYMPQQAWIQNMPLRDNILFGSAYEEKRYRDVLACCALETDLKTLPCGDLAEIGEKGINLSGGQKQRISLARACYSNADVYLLDDPLSALDSHVARHVYDHVLSSSTGILRTKTRLLATNNLFLLPYTDHIVVLKDGRMVESGSYEQLVKVQHGHLAQFMRQYSMTQNLETKEKSAKKELASSSLKGSNLAFESHRDSCSGRLIEVEKTETGSVNFAVYLKYFEAVGFGCIVLIIVTTAASTISNIFAVMWLSSESKSTDNSTSKLTHIAIYGLLGLFECVTVLARSLGASVGAVNASHRLHEKLLDRLMHSPMNFFDTTPIGRILNRFSRDIDMVDYTVPNRLRNFLTGFMYILSSALVVCYYIPDMTYLFIGLYILQYMVQKVYIKTTRQLKRLESTSKSPIYSHFSETLNGLSTIRAYNCKDRFVQDSDQLIDRNQSCFYPDFIAQQWLAINLELLCHLITATSVLYSVYNRETVLSTSIGMTLFYSDVITRCTAWYMIMKSDMETHIISVERIVKYMNNKQEDLWVKQPRPAPTWPEQGGIELHQYSTRYRQDTDFVLNNVSLNLWPGEKIGIVGRTGSGKSSLTLALFRILEPTSGNIKIDQLDIARLGLHDVRSKLTIIPQEPVLFSGSLRFNLDPLALYPDVEIWRALELAHLKKCAESLDGRLDYQVCEFGENFSVGQRQLICLARAILRKSKILVLDEATASVDIDTDSIVQKTIRDVFRDCTIITIAHRIHTVLDSDRIMVLDKGSVVELDSPARLLSQPDSMFASLVKDANIDLNSNR